MITGPVQGDLPLQPLAVDARLTQLPGIHHFERDGPSGSALDGPIDRGEAAPAQVGADVEGVHMARACCAALGGFTVPAAGRGLVCSAQREEATVLATLLSAGFGKHSCLNL